MTDVVAADRPEPVNARVRLLALARTLSVGAVAGAICGLLVGGVLGRFAMRLLAVTSGRSAQGGVTDDQAIVGEVTLRGTVTLALICTGLGALGGLIYLCVRRVLPDSLRERILGYGLFSGAIGGALFVHEHGSFDYTGLAPAWLAVAMFVALPLLFGLTVPALVEVTDRKGGLGRRVPLVVLVVLALCRMAKSHPNGLVHRRRLCGGDGALGAAGMELVGGHGRWQGALYDPGSVGCVRAHRRLCLDRD